MFEFEDGYFEDELDVAEGMLDEVRAGKLQLAAWSAASTFEGVPLNRWITQTLDRAASSYFETPTKRARTSRAMIVELAPAAPAQSSWSAEVTTAGTVACPTGSPSSTTPFWSQR